jgi:hypothetical protein
MDDTFITLEMAGAINMAGATNTAGATNMADAAHSGGGCHADGVSFIHPQGAPRAVAGTFSHLLRLLHLTQP